MNKKTIGLALSILMSLGVTACSSSGGSDDSGNARNDANNSMNNVGDVNGNAGGINSPDGNSGTPGGGSGTPGGGSGTPGGGSGTPGGGSGTPGGGSGTPGGGSTPTPPGAPVNPAVAQAATTYFADKPDSATYAFVTDPAKQVDLKSAIDNRTGSCDTAIDVYCVAVNKLNRPTGPRTVTPVNPQPQGAVLLTRKASYAGFAVVRENVDRIVAQKDPVNSYISVVYTPTTDMSAVVDATYNGNVAYSTYNSNNIYTGKLTFKVAGATVNGFVENDNRTQRLMTFEDGNIAASSNGVVFNGGAVFHAGPLGFTNRKSPITNLYSDFYGTYKGSFAGTGAEDVVGTFESDTSSKDISINGAFVGTK